MDWPFVILIGASVLLVCLGALLMACAVAVSRQAADASDHNGGASLPKKEQRP